MHSWDELDEFRPSLIKGKWPTIAELFELAIRKYPERPCFTVFEPDRKDYTYREAHLQIRRAAKYMIDRGVRKGDKVMLNGKNSPDWAIAYFAIAYAGAVVVPIDNQMKADRCMMLSEFAGCDFAICDFDVLEKMKASGNKWFASLKGTLMLKGKSDDWTKLAGLNGDTIENRVEVSESDTAAILFTSGTTGNEKGAVLTNANITSDVYQAADGMGVECTDTLYALLPLHHSYCCTAVLLETVKHGADCLFGHGIVVSRMIADMKMGKVTVFMGIPLLYNKLIDGIMKKVKEKGALTYGLIRFLMWFNGGCKKLFGKAPLRGFFDKKILSQLGLDNSRLLICGAGPLSPKVFKQYQQLGLNFLQGYGLTETAPILTLNPPSHFKTESVGKVFQFVEMVIRDKDENGIGEVRVKGDNICIGYYNDEENTKALFDEDGYLRTGDLGYLDDENYLYLKGRAKNIIVTEGGKNVFPEEIEDMFQLYGEIDQILIRGFQQKKDVPSECIEAVIHVSDDYSKGKDKAEVEKRVQEIVSSVNKNLSGYKKIEKITIVDQMMEMTTTKKIKRALVK